MASIPLINGRQNWEHTRRDLTERNFKEKVPGSFGFIENTSERSSNGRKYGVEDISSRIRPDRDF
jgi:hypothetical protein